MRLLDGRTAIITGSGRGIGAAAARLFARHGAKVAVADIDLTPAEATAAEIAAAGGRAIALAADVTDEGSIEELVGRTVESFGGVDVLVNNAGYTWDGMMHKMSDEQWEAMLAVHLTAPFKLIRACIPYMREQAKREQAESGRAKARKIINISSISGTRGNVGQANYSAGKAGVAGLTKTLAKEWGRFNIQVNALAFGYIDTRLTAAKTDDNFTERAGQRVKLGIPEELRQMAPLLIPAGRPGTAEEAAGPLLFLASELSNYVSGQVIEVTGGQ